MVGPDMVGPDDEAYLGRSADAMTPDRDDPPSVARKA